MKEKIKIGIIGLGYVGLPLARLFATKYLVIGFDINEERVEELRKGHDNTNEVSDELMKSVLISDKNNKKGLFCSSKHEDLYDCNYYIITVPTPVDKYNKPVLTPLIKASETVGSVLKLGDTVIYESTVYPGATEESCVPILQKISNLEFNKDFFVGYSPERINPGDKEHTVEKILKITSGSTSEAAESIDKLYNSVIEAGTYLAPSLKVAEAAKVIENAQRDINIAFVNELARIFNLLEIDTHEVLQAAGTKWNFLQFKPGLVGGHCIGVDPYYLAQKAEEFGYHPEIILAGRRMNDSMGAYVAKEFVKLLIKRDLSIKGAKILVLGITFKENCPDVRNTKVIDVINSLEDFGLDIDVYDPWADKHEVLSEYKLELLNDLKQNKYSGVIHAVPHQEFLTLNIPELLIAQGVIYDVKGGLSFSDKRL